MLTTLTTLGKFAVSFSRSWKFRVLSSFLGRRRAFDPSLIPRSALPARVRIGFTQPVRPPMEASFRRVSKKLSKKLLVLLTVSKFLPCGPGNEEETVPRGVSPRAAAKEEWARACARQTLLLASFEKTNYTSWELLQMKRIFRKQCCYE